jgi:hypothetical protein
MRSSNTIMSAFTTTRGTVAEAQRERRKSQFKCMVNESMRDGSRATRTPQVLYGNEEADHLILDRHALRGINLVPAICAAGTVKSCQSLKRLIHSRVPKSYVAALIS